MRNGVTKVTKIIEKDLSNMKLVNSQWLKKFIMSNLIKLKLVSQKLVYILQMVWNQYY